MKIIASIPEMQQTSEKIRAAGKSVGLVPTMGCLHKGHLSLVEKSVAKCDFTVASIFINPTQFGENEDLDTYPVDLENDKRQLESAGVDALFLPTRLAMYPAGYRSFVNVEGITDHLCGKSRPGFFRGVATVVLKLFNIVKPHKAFFGEKDWQQLAVVEALARDFNLDVAIERLPILREANGLAMSSRNLYLTEAEIPSALCLSQALDLARQKVQNGENSADRIREEIRGFISKQNGAEIDYISVCDPENFVEQEKINTTSLIALAVRVGKTRLIDNCLVRRAVCKE